MELRALEPLVCSPHTPRSPPLPGLPCQGVTVRAPSPVGCGFSGSGHFCEGQESEYFRICGPVFVTMTQLCSSEKPLQTTCEQLSVAVSQRIPRAGVGWTWPVAHISPTPGQISDGQRMVTPHWGLTQGQKWRKSPAKLLPTHRLRRIGTCSVQDR